MKVSAFRVGYEKHVLAEFFFLLDTDLASVKMLNEDDYFKNWTNFVYVSTRNLAIRTLWFVQDHLISPTVIQV